MPDNTQQHAKWASARLLRDAGWFDPTGWPLGETAWGPVYLPREVQRASAIALAPPGSGKSRGVLVPALRSEAQQAPEARRSLVVVDPAGELYRLTKDALRATHRIVVWNPSSPENATVFFDPLAYLGPPTGDTFVSRCDQAAAIWYTAMGGNQGGQLGDSYWETQPATALAALIMARASVSPGLTMAELANFVIRHSAADLAEVALESGHAGAELRAAVIGDVLKNERAESAIFGELRRRLLLATNPTVAMTMGHPSINVFDLVAIPTVLYLQVGPGQRDLQPLLSVAVSTVMAELERLSPDGRPLGREVRIVIDELANIGQLYDLANAIATLRKHHIGFLLATQTRARLASVYGRDADAIIGSCNTVLALGGLAQEDAEWVSKGLGLTEWESTERDRSIGVFNARLPSYHLPNGGGVTLPSMPVPYPRTHKRIRKTVGPLFPAHELMAMHHAMVVHPKQLRPFPCSLELYTGN